MIESGISDVVISPGSRNAPLSLAFTEARDAGLVRVHMRIDERSAAFFALGIAKAINRYVPVVVTSGTAVANLFPAVLEAYHSDDRLLLLTADRPERLRKTGSNQTTLQQGIFGNFVTKSIDASTPFELNSSLSHRGPVHFNLQFDEPLTPDQSLDPFENLKVTLPLEKSVVPGEIAIAQKKVLVVVGHDRAGFPVDEVRSFIESTGGVCISEDPLSFPECIPHASVILSSEQVRKELEAELVIVIGRTTLHRCFNTYISSAKKIMVIDPRIEDIDTRRSADEIHHVLPQVLATSADSTWREQWLGYFGLAQEAISSSMQWSEGRVAAAVGQVKCDALFISSSRPIRDVEAFALAEKGTASKRIFANRGLAGIDGNVSTAMGIATKHEKTIALIGDLAFLHDLSSLTDQIKENLTLVVVDNDGGGIFSTLPQAGVAHFEEVFGTPHGKSIKKISAAMGLKAVEVDTVNDLLAELEEKVAGKGIKVVIAKMPSREENAQNLRLINERFSSLISNR